MREMIDGVRFWGMIFPDTFREALVDSVVREYSERLVAWAQGSAAFPRKLSGLGIRGSVKLRRRFAAEGANSATRVIQEAVEKPGVTLETLLPLLTPRFDVKEILCRALENELAQVDNVTTPTRVRLEEWLHTNQFSPDRLKTVFRNMVRLGVIYRVDVGRDSIDDLITVLREQSEAEQEAVANAAVNELMFLVTPETEVCYSTIAFVGKAMFLLLDLPNERGVKPFRKLLKMCSNTSGAVLAQLVEYVFGIYVCEMFERSSDRFARKAERIQEVLKLAIRYRVYPHIIRDCLRALLIHAGEFFLQGRADIVVELGNIYARTEKKSRR